MLQRKTKVEKHGAFWCVFVLIHGKWLRMRDLYSTRQEARDKRVYWAYF
jgi:hypothetical protein